MPNVTLMTSPLCASTEWVPSEYLRLSPVTSRVIAHHGGIETCIGRGGAIPTSRLVFGLEVRHFIYHSPHPHQSSSPSPQWELWMGSFGSPNDFSVWGGGGLVSPPPTTHGAHLGKCDVHFQKWYHMHATLGMSMCLYKCSPITRRRRSPGGWG